MSAIFKKTNLEGVMLIEPQAFEDARGCFLETYNKDDFKKNGIADDFIQDNYSISKKNVLRGLHFQKSPYENSKLVRCVRGEIYDVIVDIRSGSPTLGKWQAFQLSSENKNMLYVPRGFAHGFCALSDETAVLYKVDGFYHPGYDGIIKWNDPDIGISWPVSNPILSEKDDRAPQLKNINQ